MAKYIIQAKPQTNKVAHAVIQYMRCDEVVHNAQTNASLDAGEPARLAHWAAMMGAGMKGYGIVYVVSSWLRSVNDHSIPEKWFIPDPGGCGGDSLIVRGDLDDADFAAEFV